MAKKYEIGFEGKKIIIEVSDNFDEKNPNHQDKIKQFILDYNLKNKPELNAEEKKLQSEADASQYGVLNMGQGYLNKAKSGNVNLGEIVPFADPGIPIPNNTVADPPNVLTTEDDKQGFWKKRSESGTVDFTNNALNSLGYLIKGSLTNPTGSAFNIAEQARKEGLRLMASAKDKFKKGEITRATLEAVGGFATYLFSPSTGFFTAFSGNPAGSATGMALELAGKDPNSRISDIPLMGEWLASWGGNPKLKDLVRDFMTMAPEFGISPISVIKGLKNPTQTLVDDSGRAVKDEYGRIVEVPYTAPTDKNALKASTKARETDALKERFPVTYNQENLNPLKSQKKSKPLEAKNADEVLPDVDEAFVNRASVPLTRDIVTNPTFVQKVNVIRNEAKGDKQRLYKDVGEVMYNSIKDGEVPLSSISRLTRDLKMDPAEFVKAWTTTIKESGRSLNLLSQAAKQMARDPSLPTKMKMQLNEMGKQIAKDKSITMPEKFFNVLRNIENFRRGMMVSQLATAMRNAGSAVGRITMASFDDAAQSILGGGGMKEMWNSIRSDFGALPGIRNKRLLDQVLDGNPLTKSQLLMTTVNEANLLNRVSRGLNTANVFQERAFRKYAFQAKLEKLARDAGANLEKMDPKKIPIEWLETATKHALDMTFAASGGTMAKKAVRMYNDFPILYTISNPFPRFVFANSIPFLVQHSPYSLIKALSPNVINDLAKGNSKQFAKAASRGLIGSTMLAWAMDLRETAGGEKYYELAVKDEDGTSTVIDTRSYSPLSLYLFMAEIIDNWRNPEKPSNLRAADFIDVALGLNRVSGTGLILGDILRSGDIKSFTDLFSNKQFTKFMGDWLGSFTTPAAQAVDVYGAVTGDNVVRDISGDTPGEQLFNPTIRNIPILSSKLPPKVSPIQKEVLTDKNLGPIPGGLGSQLTGLKQKKKNPILREIDRLAIPYSIWNPRTGDKVMDRRQASIMGDESPYIITNLIMSDMYQNMDDIEKKVFLEKFLKDSKSAAFKRLKKAMDKDDPIRLGKYEFKRKYTDSEEKLIEKIVNERIERIKKELQ